MTHDEKSNDERPGNEDEDDAIEGIEETEVAKDVGQLFDQVSATIDVFEEGNEESTIGWVQNEYDVKYEAIDQDEENGSKEAANEGLHGSIFYEYSYEESDQSKAKEKMDEVPASAGRGWVEKIGEFCTKEDKTE